jgi:hypothetical protein
MAIGIDRWMATVCAEIALVSAHPQFFVVVSRQPMSFAPKADELLLR